MPKDKSPFWHLVNGAYMRTIPLMPVADPDQLPSPQPSIALKTRVNPAFPKMIPDFDSRFRKLSLESQGSNGMLSAQQFLSETTHRDRTVLDELEQLNGALSSDEYQLKMKKKVTRIVIPSVISNIDRLRKTDSTESEIPDFQRANDSLGRRLAMGKNSSLNSRSTTSTIRQRTKDINWPKAIRPPENFNSTSYHYF